MGSTISAPQGSGLSQGDLLYQLALPISGESGTSIDPADRFALVVSRDCVAIRRPEVVVASVQAIEDSKLPHVSTTKRTFKDVWRLFRDVRDGAPSMLNTLYIGSLPGVAGRLVARLDRLFTIAVPSSDELRTAWIARHRKLRLSPEYQQHLRKRLYDAYATQGFTDAASVSPADLQLLAPLAQALMSERAGDAVWARTEEGLLAAELVRLSTAATTSE